MRYLSSMFYTQSINRSLWTLFWENEIPAYSEHLFKQNFRMTRQSFRKIVAEMGMLKREDTVMRPAIELPKRIAIAIYALASSAEYMTVGNLFGVGRTTVGKLVLEFCDGLYSIFKLRYMNAYPPTKTIIKEIVEGFNEMGSPQCYGAVDGTHIEVCLPKEDAVDYYNFKGWYFIILFSAVDHKCRFTYINVGASGRNNDSFVFESSMLKRIHETNPIFRQHAISEDGVEILTLIRDSAFKLSLLVMKPYPFDVAANSRQRKFNYLLAKCRRVAENAFGQLKARFRKIGRGLEVKVENAYRIIQACCVLHNFLSHEGDEVLDSWLDDLQAQSSARPQPEHCIHAVNSSEGIAIRNALATKIGREAETADTGVDEAVNSPGEVLGPAMGETGVRRISA